MITYKSIQWVAKWLVAGTATLGLNVAAQSLSIAPFDKATFSSSDAQAVWLPQNGSAAVYAADSGDWGIAHALIVPCNMPGQRDTRCHHDHRFAAPMDFSVFKAFRLEVYVPDPNAVAEITVYFESEPQWKGYYSTSLPTKKGWQTLTFALPGLASEGPQAASWEHILNLRLSPWRGSSNVATKIAVRAFYGVPRSAIALVKDPRSREHYETISALLSDAYVPHDSVSLEDVEKGYLKAAKMIILPHNGKLSDGVLTRLESYVSTGGRIMASHKIDRRLQDLLGVKVGANKKEMEGRFASLQFDDPMLSSQQRVLQSSLGSMPVVTASPIHNPRVIANWTSFGGRVGPPAWIASDTGLYVSHVLSGDDLSIKSKVLASLLAKFVPEVGPTSSRDAIADIGRIGKYANYGEAVLGFNASEPLLLSGRIPLLKEALGNVELHRNAALRADKEGRHVESVEFAKQARIYMRVAYIQSQAAGPANELRAVWSHDGRGPFPGDWARSVNVLSGNGFNAVVANVAGAGFADYGSDYLPRSRNFNVYGDQLASVVRAGHVAGVKAHAWILTWAMHGAPASWIDDMRAQNRLMQSVVTNSTGSLSLEPAISPFWLSPCDQRNRDLVRAAILEMAGKYEIDGIHLDYIRTNGTGTPYELSCKARFEAETKNNVRHWPGDVWSGPLRAAYDVWKPTIITSFVKELHDSLIPLNETKMHRGQPYVFLSAAVNPDPLLARKEYAQDWPEWISQQSVDVLHPMNYSVGLTAFNDALAKQASVIANRVPFYPGIGIAGMLGADEMIARSVATRGDNSAGIVTGGFIHYNFNPEFVASYLPAYGAGMTSNKTSEAADLKLTAVSDTRSPVVGIPFKFTVTIANHGPDSATGVLVKDWLPAGLSLNSVTASHGSCAVGEKIHCLIGTLIANVVATITITVTAAVAKEYRNEASVKGAGTDPKSADNAVFITASVGSAP